MSTWVAYVLPGLGRALGTQPCYERPTSFSRKYAVFDPGSSLASLVHTGIPSRWSCRRRLTLREGNRRIRHNPRDGCTRASRWKRSAPNGTWRSVSWKIETSQSQTTRTRWKEHFRSGVVTKSCLKIHAVAIQANAANSPVRGRCSRILCTDTFENVPFLLRIQATLLRSRPRLWW